MVLPHQEGLTYSFSSAESSETGGYRKREHEKSSERSPIFPVLGAKRAGRQFRGAWKVIVRAAICTDFFFLILLLLRFSDMTITNLRKNNGGTSGIVYCVRTEPADDH